MPLTQVHGIVANAFSIFALVVTLLAAFQLIRRQPLGGNFWGAVMIGEGLVIVQAILGIVLLIKGGQPGRGIHFLYGALSVLAWPAAYAYSQGQNENRATLVWTLVGAFLFGLSMRAVATGLPQ
jgi:hypothetical protein